MSEKEFTASEVGVLVEEFRGEIRVIGEGVVSLQKDMGEVKDRLLNVEERLVFVEDAVKVAIPDLYSRVRKLEIKAG